MATAALNSLPKPPTAPAMVLARLLATTVLDWRNMKGRIIAGPEYLTVFNGKTGEAMATVDYIPQRGELRTGATAYANRSERYLAAIAYLDGVHPSVVMCRGYYAKTVLAAFDWDGKELKTRWVFDSTVPGNEAYGGQGNHNLRVADVDGDGCDEIIYGQMTIDNDGKGLYSTGMYHGDAIHLLSDVNNEEVLRVVLPRKPQGRLFAARRCHRKGDIPVPQQQGHRPLHGSRHRPQPRRR